MAYKLGSLFDGSGGFPLAGALCGIEPCWAAEVEPYPIAVTRSRFPSMKHLGDISKVNGGEIEPVDIITFGSPCQDLSVAGKRAGLKHEANGDEETTRSGLFMEAVRIIKEMREATNGEYPAFALWENVPGAFSSNKGEDFRIVCEELIKIVEPSASMPPVPKNGWNYADSYVGDGWSLAYRVFDAQYWGVPQRRRRIYLVADFRGERAREVLFEREGLRGYFATGRTPWQTTPADAQGSAVADDREGETAGGRQLDAVGVVNAIGGNAENGQETDTFPTLTNGNAPGFHNAAAYGVTSKGNGDAFLTEERHTALTTGGGQAGQGYPAALVPYTMQDRAGKPGGGKGPLVQRDKATSLRTSNYRYVFQPVTDSHILDDQGGSVINIRTDGQASTLRAQMGGIAVVEPFCKSARAQTSEDATTWVHGRVANTLNTFDQGEARAAELVVYAVDQGGGKSGANVSEDTAPTLCTTHGGEPAVAYQDRVGDLCCTDYKWVQQQQVEQDKLIVERTPTCVAYWDGGQTVGTRTANNAGGSQRMPDKENFNCVIEQQPSYIVRRLTPTECARLQGFADWWGYLEAVDTLSQKDYQFWIEVRNTHAAINGKKVQEYTVKQMLTWYNKLWTDSSEYKMWGNGIALPTALYCVQGIVDAIHAEEDAMICR